MRERWLHSLWGKQDWTGFRLHTQTGQSLHVLHPGQWNTNQGPDFLHAQLFIDQVLWVGAVEIHVRSSDWFLHQHVTDPHYQPVILHVVWYLDARYPDLPTLELSRYFSIPQLRERIFRLGDIDSLPCHRIMRPVPTAMWIPWRNQLLEQRIQRKRKALVGPGVTTLRQALARQMGAWINRDVFEAIDASVSDALIDELQSNVLALTALYLGQGGLLNDPGSDAYTLSVSSTYATLRNRFLLNPPYRQLLLMRLRPVAHPAYRLAQLSALIHWGWQDPDRWKTDDSKSIQQQLESIQLDAYWFDHRRLDGSLVQRRVFFSPSLIEGIMINIWSLLVATDSDQVRDHWSGFGFEDNRITRLYGPMKLIDPSSADSQALLELHHAFCLHRKCGECALARYWVQDQKPQST